MSLALGSKLLDKCIYCPNPPDGREHWLNRGLGTFHGNTLLTGRICTPCNGELGRTIDQELLRSGHTGMSRQLLGIRGRAGQEKKNVFEYRASQAEPPLQVLQQQSGDWQPVLRQAIARNADGTLKAVETRSITIETADGKQTMPFPIGWNEKQLSAAAQARGLLGGKLIAAHVPPPETVDEFISRSRDLLRAVFGQYEMNVYYTSVNGEVAPVEPMIVRFNLSDDFLRAVAKVGFHYFLWACPQIGGDEAEFNNIKLFIRHGIGQPSDFMTKEECLIDGSENWNAPEEQVRYSWLIERGYLPDCIDVEVQVTGRVPKNLGRSSLSDLTRSRKSSLLSLKSENFKVVNTAPNHSPGNPFAGYEGVGTIVTTDRDRSFLVAVAFKQRDLKSGITTEGVSELLPVRQGLGDLRIACTGSDPCEITWSGINYWAAEKGVLKNVTAVQEPQRSPRSCRARPAPSVGVFHHA